MMQPVYPDNISVDSLSLPLLTNKKVTADILRLDKIHPLISGNKWFKLRFYLEDAKKQNKKAILTFGGAWSNHILAVAAACKIQNLGCIGIIRGEEASHLSSTLTQARELGMQLVFINREDYSHKKIPVEIQKEEYYIINEGGYGIKGADGAATILTHCKKENYTHIGCAVGTGTMMAGFVKAASPSQRVIGISVLKNNMALETAVQSLADANTTDLKIIHDYHFGGYAKHKPALFDFMNMFYQQTTIPTDFVYTGKLCYGIMDMIRTDFFNPGSRLLLIHSGGLQGNSSLGNGTLIF